MIQFSYVPYNAVIFKGIIFLNFVDHMLKKFSILFSLKIQLCKTLCLCMLPL